MNLKPAQIEKADKPLRETLRQVKPEERLRAILFLGPERPEAAQIESSKEISPDDFESRSEYRGALIARQQKALAARYGKTLQELRDLDLDVHGGQQIRAVVVSGKARNIVACLSLEDVRQAVLDRPIDLIEPY
jgi:hypothetical protein